MLSLRKISNNLKKIETMIKFIKNLFKGKKQQCDIPDVSKSVCLLNRKFHECEVHRCSTYGCLNCGQYKQTVC
jgi:hypothetical protein